MEQSTNREAAGKPGPIFMEHRWGQRKRCRARVYLSAGAGISGTGHVRDVSSSGAFIETTLPSANARAGDAQCAGKRISNP